MKNIFLWVMSGILLSVVAFFIPAQSGSMWPSLFLSGVVAFLYLITFSIVWLKKIESQTKRRAVGMVFAVLIVFSIASAAISYIDGIRFGKTLSSIRKTIDSSEAEIYIRKPLLKTMKSYYSSDQTNKDIGQLFRARYDSLITDDGVFKYGDDKNQKSLSLYLAKADTNQVVLVGEATFIEGKNADFTNFSDDKGRYQVKGILTSKGVRYERQN